MKRAAEQMSREDREGAQCSQKDAIDDMLSLFTSLASCRMSMGLTMEKEVAEMIARSTRELVEASKLQESVVPKLRGRGGRWSAGDLIEEELVVKTALQKISQNLYQVARKTMALSPKIFMTPRARAEGDRDRARHDGGGADARGLRGVGAGVPRDESRRDRAPAGERVAGRLGRERRASGCSSSSSSSSRSSRSFSACSSAGGSGQWSMEERAGMARLAAEQRKMEELMKQIAEESRGAHDALGKLDDLAGSMEEVARDLDEGKLDRELIDRQERIVTRMLDSQRSMRERDYKKERSSTTAGDVKALAPEAWREEIGRRGGSAQDDTAGDAGEGPRGIRGAHPGVLPRALGEGEGDEVTGSRGE